MRTKNVHVPENGLSRQGAHRRRTMMHFERLQRLAKRLAKHLGFGGCG
jgi:hypothetical protein